jgi:hypothetical protein
VACDGVASADPAVDETTLFQIASLQALHGDRAGAAPPRETRSRGPVQRVRRSSGCRRVDGRVPVVDLRPTAMAGRRPLLHPRAARARPAGLVAEFADNDSSPSRRGLSYDNGAFSVAGASGW